MTSEPSRRISSLSRPTALSSLSPRNELLQTSSARPIGLVHGRRPHRPHLVQRDRHAARAPPARRPRDPARPRRRSGRPSARALADRRLSSRGLGRLAAFGLALALQPSTGPAAARRPHRAGRAAAARARRAAARDGRGAARGGAPRRASSSARASSSDSVAGIGALRDRRVQLAVGHVRAVPAFEHLQRGAAVRAPRSVRMTRLAAWRAERFGAASSASARSRSTVKRSSVGFERPVVVAVLDVGTEPAEAGDNRLPRLRMRAELARQLEQLQRVLERDRRLGQRAGQRRALRLLLARPSPASRRAARRRRSGR